MILAITIDDSDLCEYAKPINIWIIIVACIFGLYALGIFFISVNSIINGQMYILNNESNNQSDPNANENENENESTYLVNALDINRKKHYYLFFSFKKFCEKTNNFWIVLVFYGLFPIEFMSCGFGLVLFFEKARECYLLQNNTKIIIGTILCAILLINSSLNIYYRCVKKPGKDNYLMSA